MLDQLRKKKFLEQLAAIPKPRTEYVTANQQINFDDQPLEIEATYSKPAKLDSGPRIERSKLPPEPVAPPVVAPPTPIAQDSYDNVIPEMEEVQRAPASTRAERQAGNVNTDMYVGASQALLGLLVGGGNHNRTAMDFNTANKYVSDRRNDDRKDNINLVKTVQDGVPTYTPAIEAADMEAYVGTGRSGGPNGKGAANSFILTQMYDPETDSYSSIRYNTRTNEMMDIQGNITVPPVGAIIRPVAPKVYKTEDIGGTVKNKEKTPYRSAPKTFDTTGGLGPAYNVPTEGQAKNIESAQERGQKEAEGISGSIVDASSAEKTIKDSNDPRAISAAIYSLVRSVEPKGVLTEQDFQVISGNSFLPTLEEINQFIAKKGTGNLGDVKKSYLGLAKDIKKRLQNRLDSVPRRFSPSKNAPAKKGVENTVPNAREGSKKNKAAYIQAKAIADRRWGPTSGQPMPNRLEKYLDQKRLELGVE